MAKVTFDPINKLMIVNSGVTDLDVKIDLYSDWKEWIKTSDNLKYEPAMSAVGGEPLPGAKSLGVTFFLINGWRIRPDEANHTLTINGNLYTEEGASPFVSTLGTFAIAIISSVSSLVDSTVQQLPEIEHASFEGGVTIDVTNGVSGTTYPIGTPGDPVNNLLDAQIIADARGFNTLSVKGNLTVSSTENIGGYHIVGEGATINITKTLITLTAGAGCHNTHFKFCEVTGVQKGEAHYDKCIVTDISDAHCFYDKCIVRGTITQKASVSDGHTTLLRECSSDIETGIIIDRNGASLDQKYIEFSGDITFKNQTSATAIIDIHAVSGTITIDSTCTGGIFKISGTAQLINNGTAQVITDGHFPSGVQSTKIAVESLRDSHQSFGETHFVDPVNGLDTNNGHTINSPFKTVAQALSEVVDGRGDVIYILSNEAGGVVIDERITITKNNVQLRGPGRNATLSPSVAGGNIPTIKIEGNDVSVSGMIIVVHTSDKPTANVIEITGRHSLLDDMWIKSGKNGVVYNAGDYHKVQHCEIEKNAEAGVLLDDTTFGSAYAGNGSPREVTISNNNIYINGTAGVKYIADTVNYGAGASTRFNRIFGGNIEANGTYGIEIGTGTDRVTVTPDVSNHDNTTANSIDNGTNTALLNEVSAALTQEEHDAVVRVWSDSEKSQMRSALGIDGTKTPPAANGQLQQIPGALDEGAGEFI